MRPRGDREGVYHSDPLLHISSKREFLLFYHFLKEGKNEENAVCNRSLRDIAES